MSFMEIKRFVNSGNTPLNKTIGVSVDNSVLIFRDNVVTNSIRSNVNGTLFDISGKGKIHCVSIFPRLITSDTSSYSGAPYLKFNFNLYKDNTLFRNGTYTTNWGGGYHFYGISLVSKEYLKSRILLTTDLSVEVLKSCTLNAFVDSSLSSLSSAMTGTGAISTSGPFSTLERKSMMQLLQDDDIDFVNGIRLTVDGTYRNGSNGDCIVLVVYELD